MRGYKTELDRHLERQATKNVKKPLSEQELLSLAGKVVTWQGQEYPANFVFITDHPIEGRVVGYARAVTDNGTSGQILYYEQGQVIARSANR